MIIWICFLFYSTSDFICIVLLVVSSSSCCCQVESDEYFQMNFILFVLFIMISPVTLFVTVNAITSISFSLIDVRLLLRNGVAIGSRLA